MDDLDSTTTKAKEILKEQRSILRIMKVNNYFNIQNLRNFVSNLFNTIPAQVQGVQSMSSTSPHT